VRQRARSPDWTAPGRHLCRRDNYPVHNLGGNINRYIVRMEFKRCRPRERPKRRCHPHHAYGGTASNLLTEDAAYMAPTAEPHQPEHHPLPLADDPFADQIRVRIWLRRMSVYLPVVFKNYL